MEQIAQVKALAGRDRALVSVQRQAACGAGCESCASPCALASAGGRMEVFAENAAGARVGDTVRLVSSTKKVLSAAALVYLLPVVLFLAGAVVSAALALPSLPAAALSGGLFLAGVLLAVLLGRKRKKTGDIIYKIEEICK